MGGILGSLFGNNAVSQQTASDIRSQYEDMLQRTDYLQELERQRQLTNTQVGEYVTTTGTGAGGVWGGQQPNGPSIFQSLRPKIVAAPPPDLNAMPAMQMGLTELYDLWLVKWGDKWVTAEDTRAAMTDFNWTNAAYRLHAVGKMERWGDKHAHRIIPHDVWK